MNHNSSDVIFCYIWECGCSWHSNDFKPTTSNYLAVVRVTDQRLSRLLVAYRSRLNYKKEDWLIAISTDQEVEALMEDPTHLICMMYRHHFKFSGQGYADKF